MDWPSKTIRLMKVKAVGVNLFVWILQHLGMQKTR